MADSRSIASTGIERLDARRLAVAAEGDLLDPRLGFLEAGLAMPLEPVVLLIQLDRLVERRLALFERAHNLLEPRQRGFEAQLADVGFRSGGHRSFVVLSSRDVKPSPSMGEGW